MRIVRQWFPRYGLIFKIAIFVHETWQVAEVPEVAHIPPFYRRGSKLRLFLLYGQRFPRYGPIFKVAVCNITFDAPFLFIGASLLEVKCIHIIAICRRQELYIGASVWDRTHSLTRTHLTHLIWIHLELQYEVAPAEELSMLSCSWKSQEVLINTCC